MGEDRIMKLGLALAAVTLGLFLEGSPSSRAAERDGFEHGFATNNGVRLHYATAGKGPLVVFLHGFPDFWFTWRRQMELLKGEHQVVAFDLRGYNLSDKPKGVAAYGMGELVSDVEAVIRHFGRENAIVVGHDWGGAIAWQTAMTKPTLVSKLIILNLPHPEGFTRELATNPRQRENSAYARFFQEEGSHLKVTPAQLAAWVKDPEARKEHVAALERSDLEGMLNFYKANYPREPYLPPTPGSFPRVKCSVLMIHGLADTALLAGGLAGTWDWVDQDLTLVTIPGAGHFVQHDATEKVNGAIKGWLEMRGN